MTKHLWEVDHPYYCNDGNYFNSDCGNAYKSWADFISENADSDMDLNLVFRWDWKQNTDDSGEPVPWSGDPYYRDAELWIYWMGQRKGLYRYTSVEVCRADEPAVIAFLQPRFEHMLKLWEPLATASPHKESQNG